MEGVIITGLVVILVISGVVFFIVSGVAFTGGATIFLTGSGFFLTGVFFFATGGGVTGAFLTTGGLSFLGAGEFFLGRKDGSI